MSGNETIRYIILYFGYMDFRAIVGFTFHNTSKFQMQIGFKKYHDSVYHWTSCLFELSKIENCNKLVRVELFKIEFYRIENDNFVIYLETKLGSFL